MAGEPRDHVVDCSQGWRPMTQEEFEQAYEHLREIAEGSQWARLHAGVDLEGLEWLEASLAAIESLGAWERP